MPALLSNTLHPATDGAAVLYSTVLYSAVQYIATLYGEPAWAVLAGRGEIVTMETEPIDVHFIEIEIRTRDWIKQVKHISIYLLFCNVDYNHYIMMDCMFLIANNDINDKCVKIY